MSAIGDYARPTVRLPGGAGSAFLMWTAKRVVLWRTRHARRTFVEELPFVTGSDNVDRVVTPLCVLRRDPESGRLGVESIHPYSSPEEAVERTGFEARVEGLPMTPAPTEKELAALEAIDPDGVRRTEFGG